MAAIMKFGCSKFSTKYFFQVFGFFSSWGLSLDINISFSFRMVELQSKYGKVFRAIMQYITLKIGLFGSITPKPVNQKSAE